MEKVYVVFIDWATSDGEWVDHYVYSKFDNAYKRFKQLIYDEMNSKISWIRTIEFGKDGYPVDCDRYDFDVDDSSGEYNLKWHIKDKYNIHQYTYITLQELEVM